MNTFLFIGIFIVMFTTQNILDIGCEPSQDLLDHDLREAHDKEMQVYEKSFGTSDNVVLQESDKESVLQIQAAIAASYEKDGIAELKLFDVAYTYSNGICSILEQNGISLGEKDEGVIFERVVKVYKSYLDNDKSGKSQSELIDDLYYGNTVIIFDNLINSEIYNRTH